MRKSGIGQLVSHLDRINVVDTRHKTVDLETRAKRLLEMTTKLEMGYLPK